MSIEIDSTERGLVVRAPAKLNLHLEVSEPRPDGYHDIDSLMQAVSLFDSIRIEPLRGGSIQFAEEGIAEGEENLVYRAATLLREFAESRGLHCGGVEISLRKTIPFGSGLGGGSSDAAATILGLDRFWGVQARRADLAELGAQLGSDVPFFFSGGTARCRGRGERVMPLPELHDADPALHYVIVAPNVLVSTPVVYQKLDRMRESGMTLTQISPLDSIADADLFGLLAKGEVFFNDLEEAAFRLFPELKEIASRMKKEPFLAVRMTGSGSALFGLCGEAEEAERLAGRLRARLEESARVFAVTSLPGYRSSTGD